MRRIVLLAATAMLGALMFAAPAQAFHEFRGDGNGGTGSGCSPLDGPTTDDASAFGASAANIMMLHNTFNDAATLLPITVINAGDSITWTWNSSHCHSVQSGTDVTGSGSFYSGFHYPTAPPESPKAVANVFEYPVPDLTPTLSFTHTFSTPGVYQYQCEHHVEIGMVGIVVVQ